VQADPFFVRWHAEFRSSNAASVLAGLEKGDGAVPAVNQTNNLRASARPGNQNRGLTAGRGLEEEELGVVVPGFPLFNSVRPSQPVLRVRFDPQQKLAVSRRPLPAKMEKSLAAGLITIFLVMVGRESSASWRRRGVPLEPTTEDFYPLLLLKKDWNT